MKKEFKFSYDYFDSIQDLNSDQQKAIEMAEKARKNAYAPYSNFKVGAALLLNDGSTIQGSNQENKAYPSGLCAERVALFSYGAQNNKSDIKILAIVGDGELLKTNEVFSPCGGCRQVMSEYSEKQEKPFKIVLKNSDGSCIVFEGIHHLLPFIFGSKHPT